MKKGKSIVELAQELQNIRSNSSDYVVPPSKLSSVQAVTLDEVISETETRSEIAMKMSNGKDHEFKPSKWAHQQIAEYSDIPKKYYERLSNENAKLLATNINHGFAMAAGVAASTRSGRMLRTYNGKLRAFVSSRYRRLDNYDLFEAVAPALMDLGFEPESTELTDRRLYLKCVTPRVQGEVGVGDVVQYGLVVSNSDVGAGALRVEPMIFRKVCSNGAIVNVSVRKAHLGSNFISEEVEEMLSDRTKELTDAAVFNQVRDVVTNFAKPEFFEAELNKMREAAGMPIKLFDFDEIIERTAKVLGVNVGEKTKKSIVENLATGAHGAGLNKWGLSNAFTFAAQDEHLDYEQATELERAGGEIISLSGRQWDNINNNK